MPATTVEEQWHYGEKVEKVLDAKLREKEPLFDDVDNLIQEFRIACEKTIFLDFEYATKTKVEDRLWTAHSRINGRHRDLVNRYKRGERTKLVVEKRKCEKRYADFLKTSQHFYKGYIQRLASHFEGMQELRKIAHRLQLSSQSADTRVRVSPEVAHMILLSCHATLLRLGDLSRYRNDIRTKDRSWDIALGYYGLAGDLYPRSGSSHNQRAVIAQHEHNHLDAVYYLYRALCVEEPHPLAGNNLEVEFRKIVGEWEKTRNHSASSRHHHHHTPPVHDNTTHLISWFVRLHAKLYKGVEFAGHDELENEVLSQMTVLLKEQSLETILDKFVLVNIAAEYFAGVRLQENQDEATYNSYFGFLRLNVRTLFMLLQLLQPELEGPSEGEDIAGVTNGTSKATVERITAVTRRVLPALRHYSIWFVSRAEIVAGLVDNVSLNVHVKELWKIYADTLTMLVSAFPVTELPEVDYLLEEDAATVDFRPFRNKDLAPDCDLYTVADEAKTDELKPRTTDQGISRSHPNIEMLARVRELLKDGVRLANNPKFPIEISSGQFTYAEEGLPVTSPIRHAHSSHSSISSPDNAQIQETPSHPPPRMHERINILREDIAAAPRSVAGSDSHQSMGTEMHRMVDDLVDNPARSSNFANDSTSYGMSSSMAQEIFNDVNTGKTGVAQPARNEPTPSRLQPFTKFPSLPSIWSTPFAPQPNELGSTSTSTATPNPNRFSLQNGAQFSPNPMRNSFSNSTPLSQSPFRRDQAAAAAVAQNLQAQLMAQYSNPHSPHSPHSNGNLNLNGNGNGNVNGNINGNQSSWSHDSDLFVSTPGFPGPGRTHPSPFAAPGSNGLAMNRGISNDSYDRFMQSSLPLPTAAGHYGWATPPGGQGG